MSDSDSATYSIDEAVEYVKSGDSIKKYLSIGVESFGEEDMKELLEGVSDLQSENFSLSLSTKNESDFEELLGYVGNALRRQNYGFSEYAICTEDGLSQDDRGSPENKIILSWIKDDNGSSLAVPDEKIYKMPS